mmetsp:Transcript_102637/g.319122  ORF Transcript_102637/g.319122 Transcript_102637/m.319122 type:complete len:258 (-) Transcript_102637:37-810(-)
MLPMPRPRSLLAMQHPVPRLPTQCFASRAEHDLVHVHPGGARAEDFKRLLQAEHVETWRREPGQLGGGPRHRARRGAHGARVEALARFPALEGQRVDLADIVRVTHRLPPRLRPDDPHAARGAELLHHALHPPAALPGLRAPVVDQGRVDHDAPQVLRLQHRLSLVHEPVPAVASLQRGLLRELPGAEEPRAAGGDQRLPLCFLQQPVQDSPTRHGRRSPVQTAVNDSLTARDGVPPVQGGQVARHALRAQRAQPRG